MPRGFRWVPRLLGLFLAGSSLHLPALAAPDAGTLRSVEVLVEQPPDNFAYQHGERIVYGPDRPQGAGDQFFAGLDPISLAVSVAVNVSIQSRVNRFFAQEVPAVRASLERLDLRATAQDQVRRLGASRGLRLEMASDGFPEPLPPVAVAPRPDSPVLGRRQSTLPAPRAGRWEHFVQRARASAHDAVLFVQVEPVYHLRADLVRVQTRAWLFARSGSLIQEWKVGLAGVDLSGIPEEGWHRWWAEGRYLQFALHGMRAGLQMIVDDLAEPAVPVFRARHVQSIRQHAGGDGRPVDLLHEHLRTFPMRTQACALERPAPPVRYVYSVAIWPHEYTAMAQCTDSNALGPSQEPRPHLVWMREAPEPLVMVERALPPPAAASAPAR